MELTSKAENFGILFLCLLAYLFRGNAKKIPANPKKIVILRRKQSMGDVIYMTPMFRAIKKKYPGCKVIFIGSGKGEEITKYNPDLDEFVLYKDNFWGIVEKLRKERIDFACMANLGSTLGFAMLYLAGSKGISLLSKVNDPPVRSWSYSLLKKMAIEKPLFSGIYMPPQYLELLAPLGVDTSDAHFRLYFSKKADQKIDNLFAQNGINPAADFIIGFAPGGAVEERWWPAERFAKLANYLAQKYNAKIFLIGAGKDQKAIEQVMGHLEKGTRYFNLLNQSLDEFKAFILRAKLIVGNDSGPMVTADAFDVANLVFVGPTDEREYHRPPGPLNRIVKSSTNKVDDIPFELAVYELEIILKNLKFLPAPSINRPSDSS